MGVAYFIEIMNQVKIIKNNINSNIIEGKIYFKCIFLWIVNLILILLKLKINSLFESYSISKIIKYVLFIILCSQLSVVEWNRWN